MKDFMEKWKEDSKFRAKVKLGLYTLFVIFVAILAFSNSGHLQENDLDDEYNLGTNESNNISINIPNQYNYTKNITINDITYQYVGTKDSNSEKIIKTIGENTTNYKYKNEAYYKEENSTYIITNKDEVYDIVNYNYLKLETINQYLSKSTKEENQYLVYLKDIILGNDSDDYITITIVDDTIANQKKINVDYTSLMKLFDNTITNYLVEIKIEEIE